MKCAGTVLCAQMYGAGCGFLRFLILQVHDELLIETAEEEKEKVIALLEEEMQKAADLKVELAVGTACGQDWYEAH